MQKLLLTSAFAIVAMLGIAGTPAAAWMAPQDQPQGPPPEGGGQGGGRRGAPDPERQLKAMTKRLNLTSDQQSKIKTILTDRNTQVASIRNDSSLQPDDRREKMRTLMTETNSKIEAVLDDKQKTEYKAMQAEMRERMQNRGAGGPPQD